MTLLVEAYTPVRIVHDAGLRRHHARFGERGLQVAHRASRVSEPAGLKDTRLHHPSTPGVLVQICPHRSPALTGTAAQDGPAEWRRTTHAGRYPPVPHDAARKGPSGRLSLRVQTGEAAPEGSRPLTCDSGAGDGIRTRDTLLGKQELYRWVTPARSTDYSS